MQNKATLKWLYTKQIIFPLILLTLIGVLMSAASVSLSIVTKNLIDVATNQVSGRLIDKFSQLIILIFVQLFTHVSFSTLNVRVSSKLNIANKERVFRSLLKKDWQSISDYHSGDLSNRLHSDISIITTGAVNIVPNAISLLTRILLSFITLYTLDSAFALICLVAGPVIMLTARMYSKRMKNLHKKCQETDGKTKSFMQECLQNLLVIKSFKNEDAFTKLSTSLQYENYKYVIKRNHISILASIMFFIALTVGYYFALAWCAYKIYLGLMAYGTLVAILQLVGNIQAPFKELSGVIPQYYSMLASVERIMEIEMLPDETEDTQELSGSFLYDNIEGITLKDISFAYDNEAIFDHAHYNIDKGKFIAISGISGIGKSTLLKLLLGIIAPQKGDALLKMCDGTTIRIGKQTRSVFAYVPQGNMILSGTIRDNITFAQKDVSDEEIIKAAKIAEIWDDIAALPNQLDTQLGEKGLGLSEGQIQRIAIARAVFYNAPIILLDEATSALDEETEEAVLNNLKALKTKTCIIVSHKKAAFRICDEKISIENGKIVKHIS